jgi:hypothetical protein
VDNFLGYHSKSPSFSNTKMSYPPIVNSYPQYPQEKKVIHRFEKLSTSYPQSYPQLPHPPEWSSHRPLHTHPKKTTTDRQQLRKKAVIETVFFWANFFVYQPSHKNTDETTGTQN